MLHHTCSVNQKVAAANRRRHCLVPSARSFSSRSAQFGTRARNASTRSMRFRSTDPPESGESQRSAPPQLAERATCTDEQPQDCDHVVAAAANRTPSNAAALAFAAGLKEATERIPTSPVVNETPSPIGSTCKTSLTSTTTTTSNTAAAATTPNTGSNEKIVKEVDRESNSGSSLASEAYNSEDEHGARAAEVAAAAAAEASGVGMSTALPPLSSEEREANFRAELLRRAWRVAEVRADGNCLFRAIAYAAWGEEDLHGTLRARVMDYVVEERDYFSQFVAEDFPRYVRRKRRDGTHGNHVELQAAADLLGARIEVYAYSLAPAAVVSPVIGGGGPILRLSFHRGSHYNAIIGTTPPASCAKKLAAAAATRRGSYASVADDARIAALADSLATEEELEQVALERSIAESYQARLRAGSSRRGAAEPYHHRIRGAASSSGPSWKVHDGFRDMTIGGGAGKAGPSSAGGPRGVYADSSDEDP